MDHIRTKQLLTWMENLIGEQEQVTRQLLELTTPKRCAIIADDIPALQLVTNREENLLKRMQELEEMRQRVADELAVIVGSEGSVRVEWLQELAEQVDPELGSSLKSAIAGFTNTYVRLLEANQQNAELINDALTYIESMIMVIGGSAEAVTYSSQGELGEVTMRRYLNKKV